MSSSLPISHDIINAIDRLQKDPPKNVNANRQDGLRDPIIGIITPEWYYSDSFRIFEDIDINWNSFDKVGFIYNMSKNLHKIDHENLNRRGEFERSFSSWYQSYHYLPRKNWGIHIRFDSWMRIAAKFNRNCPSLISKCLDSVKAAFLYFFTHELFHYITENASSIMEIVSGKPDIYTRYSYKIYAERFNSSECLEESLANRYLFESADRYHIDKDYLKEELLKQGDGYRDFVAYLDERQFRNGIRRLMSQIQKGILNPSSDEPLEQIMDISNPIDYSHYHSVPVWIHQRAKPIHQTNIFNI
jgi:hypothetical protein